MPRAFVSRRCTGGVGGVGVGDTGAGDAAGDAAAGDAAGRYAPFSK